MTTITFLFDLIMMNNMNQSTISLFMAKMNEDIFISIGFFLYSILLLVSILLLLFIYDLQSLQKQISVDKEENDRKC